MTEARLNYLERKLDWPCIGVDFVGLFGRMSRLCRVAVHRLFSPVQKRALEPGHGAAVGFRVLEQVTVEVEGHADIGVSHDHLHSFGGQCRFSMNSDAAAWRKAWKPYFARPSRSTTPALTCSGSNSRSRRFCRVKGRPARLGNTRSKTPSGHARRHCLRARTTLGASGMSRAVSIARAEMELGRAYCERYSQ
jgi:hypothetical protein